MVGPGERVERKGLIFCATPASDFVCGTLQLAAGMNLHVFTTGRGTPYGLAMAPVVKVATRTELAERWPDLIDIDAGRIATGRASIEELGWELFHYCTDVASGRRKTGPNGTACTMTGAVQPGAHHLKETAVDDALLQRLHAVLGDAGLLRDPQRMAPYLSDWRNAYRGKAAAVLRPASTDEVAAAVRLCQQAGVALVPQGGNTGLCGGSIPDASGGQLVLSLTRMQRIRELDVHNDTVTVEAGVILARLQQAAAEAGRLFPLSLGAEGSCTVGGNLATNAGGTAVLRYGNMRELTLGLEVVLPDGQIWNGLRGLRKDNTGYDLKQLFIGAEGTLGIITAAVLKLYPAIRRRATAGRRWPIPSRRWRCSAPCAGTAVSA